MNYIIYNDGDETTVTPMTDDHLKQSLINGWLSNKEDILHDIPINTNTDTWKNYVLIIRGEIYTGE